VLRVTGQRKVSPASTQGPQFTIAPQPSGCRPQRPVHAAITSGMHCIVASHMPLALQSWPGSQVPHETRCPQAFSFSPH
jgi:hypothetical protein